MKNCLNGWTRCQTMLTSRLTCGLMLFKIIKIYYTFLVLHDKKRLWISLEKEVYKIMEDKKN